MAHFDFIKIIGIEILQGEMTAAQVYDIPWYYLDSKQRRTFYTLLHLAQKPTCFYAIKIYEIGMPIFLKVLKMGFTYWNFLNKVYATRNEVPS